MGIIKAGVKAKDATKQAIEFLKKYDSAEVTTKLTGDERQKYLKALDIAFGEKKNRFLNQGFLPETYYHGTFKDIEKFDRKKFDPEGAVGKGVYVTSDPDDAHINYANIEGPDVAQKIERLALGKLSNRQKPFTEARMKLFGSERDGLLYPLRVRAENIADLGPGGGSNQLNFDAPGDNMEEWSDDAKKLFFALQEAGKKYNDLAPVEAFFKVVDGGGWMREDDLWKALDKAIPYTLQSKSDKFINNQVKQDIFKKLGFDAIQLEPKTIKQGQTVSFGYHYKAQPGTRHITVFNPNQVRSEFAAYDPRFKKSPLIMAGKAGVIGGAAMGGVDQAKAAMSDLAPDQVARKAADLYEKYVAEPIVSTAKKTMFPNLNVRGQEYKTASPVSDLLVEGGLDPSNLMGGAGEVIELIRMLRDMGKKEQVAQ